jgi:hypothetical protein
VIPEKTSGSDEALPVYSTKLFQRIPAPKTMLAIRMKTTPKKIEFFSDTVFNVIFQVLSKFDIFKSIIKIKAGTIKN